MIKEQIYYVKGMHCASCEILIEKKILNLRGVQSVNASTKKGQIIFEYESDEKKPEISQLNEIFKNDNYIFSETPLDIHKKQELFSFSETLNALMIAMMVVLIFLLFNKFSFNHILNINSHSSLSAFFVLGILAGLSSCAALVGGIVLSVSKQWQELYLRSDSMLAKMEPHLLFNFGRILFYGILGGVLGEVGNRLQISFQFTNFLVIAISVVMLILGLQMLGIKTLNKFQFALPKFITRSIANENNFKGRYMPFLMGALTFFLPCGFTITTQSLALLSGNFISGFLIMGLFALGTAPMLLFIGLSSVKFYSSHRFAERFSKVAGFLIVFFAIYNISTYFI